MKSFYIIAGGILVMVAVVLITPKKKTDTITEEKTSAPLDEIDAYILKEYGTVLEELSPEEKVLVHQDVADHLAREKAEMRKYVRILTADERSTQWWQEQDEAAYAKLYEERKEWIDNFPFQPRYHQNLAYDPENIAPRDEKFRAYQKELERKSDEAVDRWEKESAKIWGRTDLSFEEKHAEEEKLIRAVELADQKYNDGDPKIEEQRRIIMRHKRLAGFYKQDYRYRPEFEQAYRIFEEEGLANNPIQIADTMVALERYFVTRRQASQHEPDELHPVQTRWEDPQDQSHNPQKTYSSERTKKSPKPDALIGDRKDDALLGKRNGKPLADALRATWITSHICFRERNH